MACGCKKKNNPQPETPQVTPTVPEMVVEQDQVIKISAVLNEMLNEKKDQQ
jgi:hypothetical protein